VKFVLDSVLEHFTLGVMVGEFVSSETVILDSILLFAIENCPENPTLRMIRAGTKNFPRKFICNRIFKVSRQFEWFIRVS
jgi:hypothetical protein